MDQPHCKKCRELLPSDLYPEVSESTDLYPELSESDSLELINRVRQHLGKLINLAELIEGKQHDVKSYNLCHAARIYDLFLPLLDIAFKASDIDPTIKLCSAFLILFRNSRFESKVPESAITMCDLLLRTSKNSKHVKNILEPLKPVLMLPSDSDLYRKRRYNIDIKLFKDTGTILSKVALHCTVKSWGTDFSNELATILEDMNVPNMTEGNSARHAWSILAMCSIGLKLSKSLQFEDLLKSVDAKENEELLQYLEWFDTSQSVEDKFEKMDALLFMLSPLVTSIDVDPLLRVQEFLKSRHAILFFRVLCQHLFTEPRYITTWNTSILKRRNISEAALVAYELFVIGKQEDKKKGRDLFEACVNLHSPNLEVSKNAIYKLNKFYQVLNNNGQKDKACLILKMYCDISWSHIRSNQVHMLQIYFDEFLLEICQRSALFIEENTTMRISSMKSFCSYFFSLKDLRLLVPIQSLHHIIRSWVKIQCEINVTVKNFESQTLNSMMGGTNLLDHQIVIISKREQIAYFEFLPLHPKFCGTMLNKINNYLQQHESTIELLRKISRDLN